MVPSTGERTRRQVTLRTSTSLSSRDGASDTQSDSGVTLADQVKRYAGKGKQKAVSLFKWFGTDEGHAVLKCSFAYVLGSCGTFFPPLSNFLGHRDGKHISATITVYFHAARTVGSMIEAMIIAICAIFYAEIISLLSMALVAWGKDIFGIKQPAHALVLIICIGGGLGFVGWVKQKLNLPLVNVGASLTSIAIIGVVSKEEAVQGGYFSTEKPLQMLKILLLGVCSTGIVNVLVWRISARKVLRQNMVKATASLSDKLSFVAKGFFTGSEDMVMSEDYGKVSTNYNKAYTQMTNTLRDAKNEHYFLGDERLYQLDKSLVKCIETLSQAIGGLRSALDIQLMLMKETPPTESQSSNVSQGPLSPSSPRMTRTLSALYDDRDRLAVIDESEEEEELRRTQASRSDPSFHRTSFRAPSEIFALFIELLGPSMKSLSYTLAETLRESPFDKDPSKSITINNQLRESLRDALSLYNGARGNALQELYRSIELGQSRSEELQADIEEVAASCGHFSYSLQAVAEEIDAYLDVLEDLKHQTDHGVRSWSFLKFWRWWQRSDKQKAPPDDPDNEALLPKPHPISRLRRSALPKGIPEEMISRRDTFNWEAAPRSSRFLRSISQILLRFARCLTREENLFGIKVGIGALLWGMFAFIPSTRPIYQRWRGEWGLLSYMIVSGMTTGASNTTGLSRFYGTLIGALWAVLAWLIGQGNPFILAFCGWLVALHNFYLIAIKNAPLGRMTILAYNVVVLYSYSISRKVDDDDDDEGGESPRILEITLHRVVTVTLGILWGIFVCRMLWPISARRKFREGVSVLYLQLGLIWKRGPLGVHIEDDSTMDYMREGEQAALQRYGKLPLSRILFYTS